MRVSGFHLRWGSSAQFNYKRDVVLGFTQFECSNVLEPRLIANSIFRGNIESSLGVEGLDSGFRVQGSGFRVQGSGFRVQGSGFSV